MLGNLNSEFKKLLETNPLALVSVVETKSTLVQPWGLFKFVEPSSTGSLLHPSVQIANFTIAFLIDLLSSDEVHFLPVDHFEICKPLNRLVGDKKFKRILIICCYFTGSRSFISD